MRAKPSLIKANSHRENFSTIVDTSSEAAAFDGMNFWVSNRDALQFNLLRLAWL